MKKWFCLILSFQIFLITSAFGAEDEFMKSTQQDIILVGAAGAGGAILGLSTLSFYDDPSDHVANIWTGAAIGVIGGVLWVAYSSAARGSEDLTAKLSSPDFRTSDRAKWHRENTRLLSSQSTQFGTEIYRFSF